MSAEKTEALRLAQELDAYHTRACHKEAADELRRLHQFAEDQIGRATTAEAALQMTKATHALKIADLEAQRDALLEACRTIVQAFDALPSGDSARMARLQINAARAAIKAVEGENT